MWKQLVVSLLILLAVCPVVFAADGAIGGTATTTISQAEQSKYLSAEAQRLIRTEFDELETNIKNYQDENFRALDGEMKKTLTENTQTLVVGSLGAFMLGAGIVVLVLFRITKKHSLDRINKQVEQADYNNAQPEVSQGAYQQMQPEWNYQSDKTSWSQDYGQKQGSDYSQYSTYQVQSPYPGGWEWENGGKK